MAVLCIQEGALIIACCSTTHEKDHRATVNTHVIPDFLCPNFALSLNLTLNRHARSPHFGVAHAMCLGLAPWLAAEVPHLVETGAIAAKA